ncbi:uncharacterized protein LOC131632924 [Vicia villosa]|uniref:uncharacterized protein LOC131632924 n=1 Tax=Vicia villosa TaxID=3911 RepID=UPI00273B47DE|nr:uncharacterized protein LOC131632924 [Vicia villosa]
MVEKRVLSDHCPVWLKSGGSDWGPKHFRFNIGWYEHEDFSSFVSKEWSLLSDKGRGDYVLYEKLRRLKLSLKVRNKEVYGWQDLKIEENIDEQNDLDKFLISNVDDDISEAVEARRKVADEIWKKMEMKESMLRMKSGKNWLKEGGCNSKFFHNSLKERVCRNSFSLLETPTGIIYGVMEIKTFIRHHYEDSFKEPCRARPTPKGISFNRLEEEVAYSLERPFE